MSDDARHQLADGAQSDDETALYRTTWDEEECIGGLIVRAVAAVSNTDPLALDPIYDVIDPDAVDTIVTSLRETRGAVAFEYAGYAVEIQGSGQLTLRPRGESRSESSGAM